MEKFVKLGLSKEIVESLKNLGFKEPSEIQEKTIPLALKGKDIIGGSATGSGKTLAFSSPIIENIKPFGKTQALILTPTRELADQIVISMKNFSKHKKVEITSIYGGVNIQTQIKKLQRTDIVVGTPGRIIDLMNRGDLHLQNIKFLVLDEVDRMFDMGFRNDVEKIIVKCPSERQTMLFSATISPEIDYLAERYTRNPVEVSVNSTVDPLKLKQVYYDVPDQQKFSLLVNLLKKEKSDLVMVFCNTRRNTEFISDNLILNGIKARAIHGGLDQKKRTRLLEEFNKSTAGVLICTDVAARGLDIKGVTHVYNYDVPKDSKDYIHRIGRTARAGENGKAITILASRDYENFGSLMKNEETNITPEDLPYIERAKVNVNRSKERRTPGRNNFSRGPPRDRNQKPRNNYSKKDEENPRRKHDSRSKPSGNNFKRRPRPLDKRRNDRRDIRNPNRSRRR